MITVFSFGACRAFDGLDFIGGNLIAISLRGGSLVEIGDTLRFEATGSVDGVVSLFLMDPLLDASWSLDNPSIAKLEPLPPPVPDSFPRARIMVRGVQAGQVRITAAARGLRGDANVRVIQPIGQITLTAGRDTIVVGDTIRVSARVLDAAGQQITDVPLIFEAKGNGRLHSSDQSGAYLIATGSGVATVAARLRRARAEIAFTVMAPPP